MSASAAVQAEPEQVCFVNSSCRVLDTVPNMLTCHLCSCGSSSSQTLMHPFLVPLHSSNAHKMLNKQQQPFKKSLILPKCMAHTGPTTPWYLPCTTTTCEMQESRCSSSQASGDQDSCREGNRQCFGCHGWLYGRSARQHPRIPRQARNKPSGQMAASTSYGNKLPGKYSRNKLTLHCTLRTCCLPVT